MFIVSTVSMRWYLDLKGAAQVVQLQDAVSAYTGTVDPGFTLVHDNTWIHEARAYRQFLVDERSTLRVFKTDLQPKTTVTKHKLGNVCDAPIQFKVLKQLCTPLASKRNPSWLWKHMEAAKILIKVKL